jgi:hypothetical protein
MIIRRAVRIIAATPWSRQSASGRLSLVAVNKTVNQGCRTRNWTRRHLSAASQHMNSVLGRLVRMGHCGAPVPQVNSSVLLSSRQPWRRHDEVAGTAKIESGSSEQQSAVAQPSRQSQFYAVVPDYSSEPEDQHRMQAPALVRSDPLVLGKNDPRLERDVGLGVECPNGHPGRRPASVSGRAVVRRARGSVMRAALAVSGRPVQRTKRYSARI